MGFVLFRSATLNLDRAAVYSVSGWGCSLISSINRVASQAHTVFQPSLSFRPPPVSYSLNRRDNAPGLRCLPLQQEVTVWNVCDLLYFKSLFCITPTTTMSIFPPVLFCSALTPVNCFLAGDESAVVILVPRTTAQAHTLSCQPARSFLSVWEGSEVISFHSSPPRLRA